MKNFIVILMALGVVAGLWILLPQTVLAQNICQNDCSFYGQRQSEGTAGRTCGNYDADACLEWSSWNACDIQSFYCGDKSCNSQCGETSLNCSKDCSTPNPMPSVGAGPDKEIIEGGAVVLEGSSSDPENEQLSSKWNCNAGQLSNANILKPTYFAPSDITEEEKVVACTLRTEDKRGALSSDNVFITVKKRIVSLQIDQLAKNLTQKQTSWQKNVSAVPSDLIEFRINITAMADTSNILLKAVLPQGMSYAGNLKIDGISSNKSIVNSSLSIGNLGEDKSKIITFQAKILPENYYTVGTTGIVAIIQARANSMSEISDSSSINVIKPYAAVLASAASIDSSLGGTAVVPPENLVKGATMVSTGTFNKIFESLLPPFFISLLLIFAFKSKIIWLDSWLDKRKQGLRNYETESALKKKISQIKTKEPEIYETWRT